MEKVNLAQKLQLFHEHWKPKIVGELNGQMVKLVKFQGPFVWHHHQEEDEMFLVIQGRFRMEFRTVRCGWRKVNSSSCHVASNIVPGR